MYNAYLTSDYTTQVEELDNSYGTAQDWADLHEYEENELKVWFTQAPTSHIGNCWLVHIDWGMTNNINALDLIFEKLKDIPQCDTVYFYEEDAKRLIKFLPKKYYQFLYDRSSVFVDGSPFRQWADIWSIALDLNLA